MTIPIFAIEIPLLGSLANIIGIFMGAVVSGIIGALALNLINRLIADKKKKQLEADKIDKRNEVLETQGQLIEVGKAKLQKTKADTEETIKERHQEAATIMKDALDNIRANSETDEDVVDHDEDFKAMDEELNNLLGGIE